MIEYKMTDTQKTTTTVVTDADATFTGRVKWFNNKAGYGFITVVIGDRQGEDIFVHHSGVKVSSEQYKYLVQGEYVEFSLKSAENTEHPYQAFGVTGVGSGKLMCETRTEQRQQRELNGEGTDDAEPVKNVRRGPRRNQRGGNTRRGPRKNQDEWGLDSRPSRNTQTQSA